MKIAICDNDEHLTWELEKLILQLDKSAIVDIYHTGTKLLNNFTTDYNLIYLAVDIGKPNGIEVGLKIRALNKNIKIIYITSNILHAPACSEVDFFRFMIKPINKEKFRAYYIAVMQCINTNPKYFRYTFKKINFQIHIDNIIYFNSQIREVHIYTLYSQYRYYAQLDKVEQTLIKNNIYFCRANKSYLVNPKYISMFSRSFITLTNGQEISISTKNRATIQKLIYTLSSDNIIIAPYPK
ncbi:hypothetical protein AN641_08780 [Candidatus Epulonipiscioides gigas]|nr:hypothetical protein AN641_08780 [Epulopiscium sp. SCG-C07WGA-EpuloA2]